jgi:hypothetical protein
MTAVRVSVGLSGGADVDVSSSVVSVSVQRGRSDETEPFQGGRASLVLRNVSGTFDPVGTAVFRLRDDVEVAWLGNGTAVPVFTGFVEDVTLDYDLSGDAIVNVSCVDGLALLANQTLVDQTVSAEQSGDRVASVLGNVGVSWPAGTAIDTGISELAAGTATGNALEYLRQAEESEQGYLYVDRLGTLTFRNRHTTLNDPIAGTQFSDDGVGLPYQQIERFSGARSLFNRITGELEDGTAETADNLVSQAEFSIRTLGLGKLLLANPNTLKDLTEYLLARYAEPATRVDALTVNLSRLSASDAEKVASFELVDVCDVEFTPPGRSAFTSKVLVQGVRHDVTVGGAWRVSLSFEERDVRSFLVLDDPVFGKLDENVLAF